MDVKAAFNFAKEFLQKTAHLAGEELNETLEKLPKLVQSAYWKLRKDAHFSPENCSRTSPDVFSESGKYRLVVHTFETAPNTWSYTQGDVYLKGSQELIAKIQRNYSSFLHYFIEDHPNGHDYLVAGEDYQGQTVIELDTGKRLDFLPKEADTGAGFCWIEPRFDRLSQTLIVCGCIWACPYEFRFYDFSDPMSGWPYLLTEILIDDDSRWPKFGADGTVICYQSESNDGDSDEDSESPPEGIASTLTFRREGGALVLVKEWVSDKEKTIRDEREKNNAEYERKMKLYKETDPLYLKMKELSLDPALSPEDYMGYGVTFDGWCPDFKTQEQRITRGIVTKKPFKIDVEWGAVTGPVKLVVYKDKQKLEDKFFPHSVEAMVEAFVYAKKLISEG